MIFLLFFIFSNFFSLAKGYQLCKKIEQHNQEVNDLHIFDPIQNKISILSNEPQASSSKTIKSISEEINEIYAPKIHKYKDNLKLLKENSVKDQEKEKSASKSNKAITCNDFSNANHNNLQGPLIFDDYCNLDRLENSQFINFNVDEGDYFIIIRKSFTIENVIFSFDENSIQGQPLKFNGVIQIECEQAVTIRNCEFIRCSFRTNQLGCVINFQPPLVTGVSTNDQKLIEKCTFTSCGGDGQRMFIIMSQGGYNIEVVNCTFDCNVSSIQMERETKRFIVDSCVFKNTNQYNVPIEITYQGEFEIKNSFFINNKNGSILYNAPNIASVANLFICRCQFVDCIGESIHIETESKSEDFVEIIENKFEHCYNEDSNKAAAIGFGRNTDSIQLNIENNKFNECGKPGRGCILILLDIEGTVGDVIPNEIEIKFNQITFEPNKDEIARLALKLCQFNRRVIIHNNSFTNCYRYDNAPWANTIHINKLSTVTISENSFYQCGSIIGYNDQITTDGGGNVIGILGSFATECIIQNCTFSHSSAGISTYVEGITVLGNEFINCGRNTVRITSSSSSSSDKAFQLIENHFIGSTVGCAIYIWKDFYYIKNTPTIFGNTFENIQVMKNSGNEDDKFAFIFKVGNVDTILFENNTFRNIRTRTGGFGGKFETEANKLIYVTFSNCIFENNSQTTNGGAFCSTNDYNKGEIKLTFKECYIESNTAEGNGGALFIDTLSNVKIEGCQFISNKSTGDDSGFGGSIYISKVQELSITGCEFKDNFAREGQAIYGTSELTKFNLQGTEFNHNINTDASSNVATPQYMIVLEIGSLDISNVQFNEGNDDETGKIAYPILFKSLSSIENIIFTEVTSTYSVLLHIEDENLDKITFNNIEFNECSCKEYVVDVFCSIVTFNKCTISFTATSNEECGGIRINTVGEIEIKNSTFTNTKSSSGTIQYKHSTTTRAAGDKLSIIGCQFTACIGESIHLETETNSDEEVEIIENKFEHCYNEDSNKAAAIGFGRNTDSIQLNIENNKFNECGKPGRGCILILLDIEGTVGDVIPNEIEIKFNQITFEPNKDEIARLAFKLCQFNRRVIIHNNSFTNCYRYDNAPWANTIYINKLYDVNITENTFYRCGALINDDGDVNIDLGGNVIGILGNFNTESIIRNNTFDTSSSAVSSFVEGITVLGNKFINCAKNTVRVTRQIGLVDEEWNKFELIENHFVGPTLGSVVHLWQWDDQLDSEFIHYQPIIRGNTFEYIRVPAFYFDDEHGFAFTFNIGEVDTILFDNNTFRNIQTGIGGFGGKFDSIELTHVTFYNCFFEECSQTTNGGAFCSTNEYNNRRNIELTFKDCHFENNTAEGKGGALFIDTSSNVKIERCQFISNKATGNSGLGGAIYISKVDGELNITGCEFKANSAQEGQAIYGTQGLNKFILHETEFNHNINTNTSSNIVTPQYMTVLEMDILLINSIKFTEGSQSQLVSYPILFKSMTYINNIDFINVNSSYSPIIYIPQTQTQSSFDNISFYNCYSQDSIVEFNGQFSYLNSIIHFDNHQTSAKPINIQQGTINIDNIIFRDCFGGISVGPNIDSAEIRNSYFYDCYSQPNDAVFNISNRKSFIDNNSINFTSNSILKSICGIHINSHGDHLITNNNFIRIRNDNNNGGSIYFIDAQNDSPSQSIVFNFNTIDEVGSAKFSLFFIRKIYDFNIDHNIIKNCKVEGFSSNIVVSSNQQYKTNFAWTNLTLINSHAKSLTGGGLGLWIEFENKKGKFSLINCHFENNAAKKGSIDGKGYGGAFGSGYTSIGNMELCVENCIFINNYAEESGGALSIQSGLPAMIYNSTFINNNAENGGGAIFIHPSSQIYLIPNCTISRCIFKYNKDSSNNGHAIYFKFDYNCKSNVQIKDDCYFYDNYNNESDYNGFTISSDAPELTISNSKIEFSNNYLPTSGLRIESHTQFANINYSKFINNYGKQVGAIFANGVQNDLSITDCLFFNSSSANVTCFILLSQNPINFDNNTIQDIIYEENIGTIEITGLSDNVEQIISNCIFKSNARDPSSDIITSTILLRQSGSNPIGITYSLCSFIDNTVYNGSSGANSICLPLDSQQVINISINNCTFSNNTATKDGGSLYLSMVSSISIFGSIFSNNHCQKRGGAIFIDYYVPKSEGTSLFDELSEPYCDITYCTFERNTAEVFGNAIFINDTEQTHIYTIENN